MRVGPGDFEGGFLADEEFGAAGDVDGQGVGALGEDFGEAFFLQVQAFVGVVEGHAQGVRAEG